MLSTLLQAAAAPAVTEALFDRLADVVFFIKDTEGRYQVVNTTLMRRCGCASKQELIGRDPLALFPAELGASYAAQDREVLASGRPLADRLELHLYPSRSPGWCLTYKLPLLGPGGAVVGLAGISRDLRGPDRSDPVYARIAAAVAHIQQHYAEPLRLPALAAMSQLSPAQFERQIERIFGLSPKQLIIKTRVDAAAQLLASPRSIAEVAQTCGYADHSSFTRQFRAVVGLAPSEYRALRMQRG
ncbi:AraC family transcriptional regulator [Chloroflexia bacterium SDU3-3]|nr:AraC family transcriptional regulator [Chloroflexia bacterium SDU3-3]